MQWNAAAANDVEDGVDWGDLGLDAVDLTSVAEAKAGSVVHSASKSLPSSNESGTAMRHGSAVRFSSAVGQDFTRASVAADFSLSEEQLASITSAELLHNELMGRVAGADWRAQLGRDWLDTGNPVEPKGTEVGGKSGAALGKTERRQTSVQPPSWLKKSGPVIANHNVQMELKPTSGNDCVLAGCSHSRSPKGVKSPVMEGCPRRLLESCVVPVRGSRLLDSAKLSTARRSALRQIWQVAGSL